MYYPDPDLLTPHLPLTSGTLLSNPSTLLCFLNISLFSHLQALALDIPSTWTVCLNPKPCFFGKLLFILQNPT